MNDPGLMGSVNRFVGTLKHCQHLGIRVLEAADNHLLLELPYSDHIIGNPDTRVIHGGAITTLMDTASGAVIICALPEFELCPTLDLRMDYMRPAKPDLPVFAAAHTYRVTQNIVFTRCVAYQGSPDNTIADCVATFMRIGVAATPKAYRELISRGLS
ncbi:PaaI family thioesterase [Hydrocarboniclastica marina]|uniref:PaaI family thioesterase n=1 Tax=Hydrocarboniclastica marina TaxID=2259620 RepID=A0A4P7XHP4_9ALTE|nr:PaaI family thioesterase [Hydrocarboniclastica marina]MAL98483.1 thioesterase [Alteromonadaceae bacterium]QCF25762.1 PaaI family thioesterase [Hydrocarboniclastica marina]|tara:strand:- start:361 stop:834 length:474 start_codon:yes stop_codon:yes gene_type:complete